MFAFRRASALTLLVIGLLGWTTISAGAAVHSARRLAGSAILPRTSQERAVPLPAMSFVVSSSETPVLDDEVEQPDEEEDDEPDDPGQALEAGGRPAVLWTDGLALNSAVLQPSARARVFGNTLGDCDHPRYLMLQRVRC